MQKSRIFSFLLLLGLFFTACQKDNLTIIDEPVNPSVVTKYEVTVNGTVTDQNDNALEAAVIQVGDMSVLSDQNGRFSVTGLVNSNKASVAITKDGYFSNYPVFYPEKGESQEIRVQLRDRIMAGSVNNGSNEITLDNHSVNFGSSNFKNEDGSNYTGTVNVYMDYLDPTDENLQDYMPGDLVGVNTDNEEQLLVSYGMFNVELEDENGRPISLDGEATLSMAVPSELVAAAPATIPLWYFDEISGNWIEEGMATLEGDVYVGTVTHFTLWNCDAPFDLVTINGIINTNGSADALTVRITRADGNSRTTIPNSRGYFEGKVPKDEMLLFEILGPCLNVIYSETIGGFGMDTDIGSFDVDSEVIIVNISGTAVDCDMNPVMNGYAYISIGSEASQFTTIEDGTFSDNFIVCTEDPISVTVYDIENAKLSNPQEFDFNTTLTTGQISACDVDLPDAGMYINGPDIDHFIPATSGVTGNQDSLVYEITLLEDFGNGNKVIYTVTVLNWTGSPSNPSLVVATSTQIIGSDVTLYSIGNIGIQGNVVIDEVTGGLFDVEFTDAEIVVEDASGVNAYPNHSFRIVGIFN